MSEDVKPRRRYESNRRRLQAEQTRRDIVAAADRLFRERGHAVPMPVIAAEAGVVVETIYRIFGSKAGLVRAVVEALLAGGTARAEVPVEERPAIRAIIEEPDPARQVARYAATQPGIHRRAGGLLRAVRAGAATDPDLARLWAELEAWRLEGQGRFLRMLDERRVLKAGLTFEAGRDVVWTLCSLAIYDMLVLDRGWSDDQYEVWLTQALSHALLEPRRDD
jgi:AcrR family transcriptional regulator